VTSRLETGNSLTFFYGVVSLAQEKKSNNLHKRSLKVLNIGIVSRTKKKNKTTMKRFL
jgi:hypothetical protein